MTIPRRQFQPFASKFSRLCPAQLLVSDPAGRSVEANEACCVVESTKAASDVYAPIAGEIVAGNEALGDAPQLVNEQPFEGGWLFRIKPANPADLDALLSADDYQQALKD